MKKTYLIPAHRVILTFRLSRALGDAGLPARERSAL